MVKLVEINKGSAVINLDAIAEFHTIYNTDGFTAVARFYNPDADRFITGGEALFTGGARTTYDAADATEIVKELRDSRGYNRG